MFFKVYYAFKKSEIIGGILGGSLKYPQTRYPQVNDRGLKMALTDIQVKAAKPKDKAYKLSDAGGLHLFVTVAGGKFWRLKYRFEGKEKRRSLGAYPAVSLLEAREKRDEARIHERQLLGIQPFSFHPES